MIRQSRAHLCVLLTRPLSQSQRFATDIANRFGAVNCIISPVLEPVFLNAQPAPAASAVIFTSQIGVEAAAQAGLWRQGARPDLAYCVGTQTAKAAADQGFYAIDAMGDWRDLAAMITANLRAQPSLGDLVFACAAEAPLHLENALISAGHKVHRREVYSQNPRPLSAQAQAALTQNSPVILPLFSPRSAAAFCAAVGPFTAPLLVAALSQNVADAFTGPCQMAHVARRPNAAAMLDCIGEFLQTGAGDAPLS